MDAKFLSKENHLHSAHRSLSGGELIRIGKNVVLRPDTCGCGDAIVFSRVRPDYGAPRKKPIHLWLSAREALPKIDPRKRSWDKSADACLGPLPSESMLTFFMEALFFRQGRGRV